MPRPLAVLATVLLIGAFPAQVMACELMSIRYEYWRHQERPESFVLVHGAFRELTFVRHEKRKDRSIWRATFVGHGASARAFDKPFAAEVTIVDNLYTGMEGETPDPRRLGEAIAGVTGLVFLERTEDDYRVETEFCTPLIHTNPADVKPALACLAGRRCPRE